MKKKLHQLLFLFFVFASILQAQPNHTLAKKIHKHGHKGIKIAMPSFNKQAMMREDSIREKDKVGGVRFAKQFEVAFSPDNSGETTVFENGSNRWELEILSDSAYSINLIFSKFHLLPGDTLFVYGAGMRQVIGPLTEKNNLQSGILPLVPIDGDRLSVVFIQSPEQSALRRLEIGSVNHDYRGFRGLPSALGVTGDTCSYHVTCVPEIAQIKRSVCLLILNGSELCTGTLVNNTAQDGKPYLLSAAHCFDTANNGVDFAEGAAVAPTLVAFFNYEAPNCLPAIRGSMEFSIGGATLKALAGDIDFALVELSSTPPEYFRTYYAGWNLSATPSPPFAGIHHPLGTVKRYAKDENAIAAVSYGAPMLSNSHWRVFNWEDGTTEAGSSGSPLFDASYKMVGALTGGLSYCHTPNNDYYYRLNKAWDFYPESTKQLKAWLDPTASGATTINGLNPYGNDSALRFSNIDASTDLVEIAYLQAPESGYLSGHNSLQINQYAEKFSLPENAYLYGMYFMSAKANAIQSNTDTVIVKIYAGESTPNPSYFLEDNRFMLNTLQWSSSAGFSYSNKGVLSKNENYLSLETPIPVGKNFFVVYELPYTNLPADSFAIYTAKARAPEGLASAYAYFSGSWQGLATISGERTSLWIDPVIRYDSTAVAIDTALIDRSSRTVIYPNPAKNTVFVMTRNDKQGDCTVTLYSTFGQKISSTKGKVRYPSIAVNLEGLSPGLYLLRVAYSDKSETHKLIVQ